MKFAKSHIDPRPAAVKAAKVTTKPRTPKVTVNPSATVKRTLRTKLAPTPVVGKTGKGHEGVKLFADSGLKETIARLALTGVLRDGYHRSEDDLAKEMVATLKKGAQADPVFVLKAAIASREHDFKLFPKLALASVLARQEKDEKFKLDVDTAAAQVLSTFNAGQILEALLVAKAKTFGVGLGRRVQSAVSDALKLKSTKSLESMTITERQNLQRVLRLAHPELPKVVSYVMDPTEHCPKNGKAVTDRQKAMEGIKNASMKDAAVADLIRDFKLPFNVTKGVVGGRGKVVWEAIRDNMTPMQLLINLKSLDEKGVINATWVKKAFDGVDQARLLPLDLLRPYVHADPKFQGAIADFMARMCDKPIPGLEDKSVHLAMDFSGSMTYEYKGAIKNWQPAVVLAASVLGSCEDRSFVLFNTGIMPEGGNIIGGWGGTTDKKVPVLKGKSGSQILKALLPLSPNGGTHTHLVVEDLIARRRKVDVVMIVTDEQENGRHGVYTAWNRYRKDVNPDARLLIVNCSNTAWHVAPGIDKSVTIIQSITPSIYQNLLGVEDDVVDVIERIALPSARSKAEKKNTARAEEFAEPLD
jgi:60 kDa SS-A/Ro ribonucleoprotein